ncbi:hypothetical protein [Vibrio sp. LaRot3]|uniref:hypothetical protein n=1 Tax=Vibrio sp. LaRot3 TaxID=2998829 RepID=UPI0022CDC603|nr:hypothetical protein [Vibrio sp. LaRot3]MDA0148058.1 hypothetical protein [Vibrio sp. LaRot3]
MSYVLTRIKYNFYLLLTALLVGCGGGGGGDDGGSSGGGNNGGGSGSTAPPASTNTLTVQDLAIDPENKLESVYQVDISVDISSTSTERAFISVCDNSEANGDISQVDFEMCLLKSSLTQGKGSFDLRVANHCEELIAVIWIMEQGRQPITYTLSHNNQRETTWTIN